MPDADYFLAFLKSNYAIGVTNAEPVYATSIREERAVLRVEYGAGVQGLFRAYRASDPVPDWQAGTATLTSRDWLLGRAATLTYLARYSYASPRVITARSNTPTSEADGWCGLLTTFTQGTVSETDAALLHGIGAALGKLHRATEINTPERRSKAGRSWLYPPRAIAPIVKLYANLAPTVPADWQPLLEACADSLRAFENRNDLPFAIVHGDAWPGNAVRTPRDEIVLIDWEAAGQGLAVLDLGRLLLYGHFDINTDFPTPFEPQAWRIQAIMQGYASERALSEPERAVLGDAIRFGIACGAINHFQTAQRDNWSESDPHRLVRRREWHAASEAIAQMALQERS